MQNLKDITGGRKSKSDTTTLQRTNVSKGDPSDAERVDPRQDEKEKKKEIERKVKMVNPLETQLEMFRWMAMTMPTRASRLQLPQPKRVIIRPSISKSAALAKVTARVVSAPRGQMGL